MTSKIHTDIGDVNDDIDDTDNIEERNDKISVQPLPDREHILQDRKRLCNAVRIIAWAYLLLHLDLTFGTVNVLPDWAGYLLILDALPVLAKEESSAVLLKPLCIILSLWEGIMWCAAIFGAQPNWELIGLLVNVVGLYFHFQLLTDLALIAEKYGCPEGKRILKLRTVRTILLTLTFLPQYLTFPDSMYEVSTIFLIGINLVVAYFLCRALFSLCGSLTPDAQEERDG